MKHHDKVEKISITLPHDMLVEIRDKVKSGIYASTSEVIREAMRLWQRQEEEHEARLQAIRERLELSAHSGKPVPLNLAFNEIQQLHDQRIMNANADV